MKIMKAKKQIVSCVLTVLLLAQAGSAAFAAQPEQVVASQGGVKIEQISDKALSVTSAEGTSILTVDENSAVRTVTITDSKTGQKEYMRFDKKANTLYSSITGETVQMMGPLTSRSKTSYETHYISYAQIQRAVGYGAKATQVIGVILSFTEAHEVGRAMGLVSKIVNIINSSYHASSSHGVRLVVKETRYYRHRGGSHFGAAYKITHDIVSASTY